MGLPWDDCPGLATAAHSSTRPRRHKLLVHGAARPTPAEDRGPPRPTSAEDRGPPRPTSAEDREPTCPSRAGASGAAGAGRSTAILSRSDEPTHAREGSPRS